MNFKTDACLDMPLGGTAGVLDAHPMAEGGAAGCGSGGDRGAYKQALGNGHESTASRMELLLKLHAHGAAPLANCASLCSALSFSALTILPAMHLMYYCDANGKRIYTLKVRLEHGMTPSRNSGHTSASVALASQKTTPEGAPTFSAHPGANTSWA